jgi:hypothetical protein
MTTLKNYIALHQLVRIKLEGEYVYGIFVEDVFMPTKIAFKSVICPDFIRRDNAIMGDSEEDGMTGFYCEVDSVLRRGDDLYIAFPSIEREIFFHYVEVIESTRQLG